MWNRHSMRAYVDADRAMRAQAAPTPSEWDVRGRLAASLTCWHRLTGQEAAELVALFQGHPAQAAPAAVQCVECNSCGSAFDIDTYMAGYTDGKGHCLNCHGIDHDATQAAPAAHGDALDAAFEAVRHRLCELQRYSFVLDDDGVVRRVQDRVGNWIEFDDAHALFDPVAVDAARSQAKEGGA